MAETLLLELRTEELPPKLLSKLGKVFSEGITLGLKERGYCPQHAPFEGYAAPRRLAVRVTSVEAFQPDRIVERKGPAKAAGHDAQGNPTPALSGFARSCGIALEDLETSFDAKGIEIYLHRSIHKGSALAEGLQEILTEVLAKLPVHKVMRWGAGDAQFVRPVHGLIALHGNEIVPIQTMGHHASNTTLGHRFLSSSVINIHRAEDYASTMEREGKVIASFTERREKIRNQLDLAAKGAKLLSAPELLDEVTALVEWPFVYSGEFDASFLDIPTECLTLSMQQHQKYFPLGDINGKLLNRFLLVSNIETDTPDEIIHGNERVLRARLSDARFFYQQDRKQTLESRVAGLSNVVYHNKLGSVLNRIERLEALAQWIANALQSDPAMASRAALLCKADLVTEMVGEFPELQGMMGAYYARHDGESEDIAHAIGEHYRPRFAGDDLPNSPTACAVALADKLDVLSGIYGIGQIPTGDKDPFGLRRQALGVVRILMERGLPIELPALLDQSASTFPDGLIANDTAENLYAFILDRARHLLREKLFTPEEIESVLSTSPARFDTIPARLEAVKQFRLLEEAPSLSAANKRIRNILRKAESPPKLSVDSQHFSENAEHQLFEEILRLAPIVESQLSEGDYVGALKALSSARGPVDEFFDTVMVMADDQAIRNNRLSLLARLEILMNRVADISKLST
jgi:glycyl-tRNA synthetase beta chain